MDRADDRLLPVPVLVTKPAQGARRPSTTRAEPMPSTDPAYVAQLYGQSGQRRGLHGGVPVLEAARAAYLEAEYSGENDRRPPQGVILKKAI